MAIDYTCIKRMDINEFQEFGYLQELNRQFLHPLGLALEVNVDLDTGKMSLGGIWDYRDDPEGMLFDEFDANSFEKIGRIRQAKQERIKARIDAVGDWIQEPERTSDSDENNES